MDNRTKIVKALNEATRRRFANFCRQMYPQYTWAWFHLLIMRYIQLWIDGDIKKLAIFVPPQHAKSTLSSILAPAYILGRFPKAKVVCGSYTEKVASKFNRGAQDILSLPRYKEVFPDTYMTGRGIESDNELRNSSYFETVGHKGYYKSVGVGGGLTGFTIDFGVIDDPIKDRKEANSAIFRDNLWDWYIDVWSTRLNNNSRELMLFTRWHEDDLAGRIFDPENVKFDQERADQWTVIVLPALKEDAPSPIKQAIQINDPRNVDEALWEEMHSAKTHMADRRNNPYTFASLKQQRPSPLEGGLMQRSWFNTLKESELPFNPEQLPVHFMIDGAFTDKTENDPTALLAYYKWGGKCYIKQCISVRKEMYEFLSYARGWMISQGYDHRSNIRVEFKSSGPAIMSMMSKPEYGSFNMQRIAEKHVSYGKYTRGEYAQPSCASEKVILIQGGWNESFLKQITTFPNDTHDDMFDLLCYMVLQELEGAGAQVHKTSVNLGGRII